MIAYFLAGIRHSLPETEFFYGLTTAPANAFCVDGFSERKTYGIFACSCVFSLKTTFL